MRDNVLSGGHYGSRQVASGSSSVLFTVTCQHKKKTWHSVFTFYLLPFKVFFSREISFTKPTPFLFSLFAAFLSFSFLYQWRQLSFLQELKSAYLPRILKLMWNSSTLAASSTFSLIRSSLQISWRRLATEDAGVNSDRTTCGAKILECGVIQNTWIRGRKATFLNDDQICWAAANYTKIIDRRMLERPIQVNGAIYSIKKSCVIKTHWTTV